MSEPCHICGYHPGMGICSRMHDNPEAMTPLQADLAEAVRLLESVQESLVIARKTFRGTIANVVLTGAFIGTETDIYAFLAKHKETKQ